MAIISSDDDDDRLIARHRDMIKRAPLPKMPAKPGSTAAVEESSDDDDALLQRHTKRIAGAQVRPAFSSCSFQKLPLQLAV